MTTKISCLFLALAACLPAASARAAAIVTTATGSNGADSYVSNDTQQASTTTHGGETGANLRNLAATRRKVMYSRFDLSTISGDRSAATLSLFFLSANRVRTINVYGLNNDVTDDVWSEAGLNYQNAPGILQPSAGGVAYESGEASFDLAKLTLLGTFTSPGAANTDLTTVPASLNLDSFLNADTNNLVTFVIDVAATDANATYSVATKENASAAPVAPPRLTLPNAVPEPSTLASAAIGLACLALRRRK